MSLIDRETLLSFEKMDADLCATCGEHHTAEDVIMMIKTAPTVDAVPVVRCRECKHFRHYGKTSLFINGKNIKAGWCQRRISYDEEYRMTADDFCSYGERKEGANNDGGRSKQ